MLRLKHALRLFAVWATCCHCQPTPTGGSGPVDGSGDRPAFFLRKCIASHEVCQPEDWSTINLITKADNSSPLLNYKYAPSIWDFLLDLILPISGVAFAAIATERARLWVPISLPQVRILDHKKALVLFRKAAAHNYPPLALTCKKTGTTWQYWFWVSKFSLLDSLQRLCVPFAMLVAIVRYDERAVEVLSQLLPPLPPLGQSFTILCAVAPYRRWITLGFMFAVGALLWVPVMKTCLYVICDIVHLDGEKPFGKFTRSTAMSNYVRRAEDAIGNLLYVALTLYATSLVRLCLAYSAWFMNYRNEADYLSVASLVSFTALIDITAYAMVTCTVVQMRGFIATVNFTAEVLAKEWEKKQPEDLEAAAASADNDIVSDLASVALEMTQCANFWHKYTWFNIMPVMMWRSIWWGAPATATSKLLGQTSQGDSVKDFLNSFTQLKKTS